MDKDVGSNFSIREISNKYSKIFLDSNMFFNMNLYISKERKENPPKYFEIMESLYDFWIPVLRENPQICLTKNILGELNRDHFNYKKELKKHRSFAKENMEVMRIKKRLKNKRNTILDEFPAERVIDINNLEENTRIMYNGLYERYKHFTVSSKNLEGMGEADFDLLLLGGVFSKTKGNTCLLSNDFSLLRGYKFFLSSEGQKRENFGFYMQRGINFFTKV